MIEVKPIRFCDTNCAIELNRYQNGNGICIDLNEVNTNEPVARVTINCPDEDLLADEVVIKDYSENEGILKVLIEAEIIASPHKWTREAFPICKLLLPCPK